MLSKKFLEILYFCLKKVLKDIKNYIMDQQLRANRLTINKLLFYKYLYFSIKS